MRVISCWFESSPGHFIHVTLVIPAKLLPDHDRGAGIHSYLFYLIMNNPNIIKILDQLVFHPQTLPTLLQKAHAAQKILDQNPDQNNAFILIDQ